VAVAAAGSVGASEKKARGKPVTLFNGKNLDGWKVHGDPKASRWIVGIASLDPQNPGQLTVAPPAAGKADIVNSKGGGLDIYTVEKFGDATIDLEFMVPKGSNSGVYVMGEYEIQILDSYGRKKVGMGDLGGLYGVAAPRVNAARKPGEWQHMTVDYRAPRFTDGKKVENARLVRVTLNDQVIHENVEIKGATPGGVTGQEHAAGPLMFQGTHGPVACRNIQVFLRPSK